MRPKNEGPAAVLVYADGRVSAVLAHGHDGGEAYMGPLIRKGIAYAKVQYESGAIADILAVEEDTVVVTTPKRTLYLRKFGVRHVYYVTYTWDPEAQKKHYHVYAKHLADKAEVSAADLPDFAREIPKDTTTLV